MRNFYICFVCLTWVWAVCEEYWYLFYSPRTGLRHLWTMFISALFASPGSQPSGTNINISYLFCSPKTGLRVTHTGLRCVWGILISVLFTWDGFKGYSHRSEVGMRNFYICFVCLTQVWAACEEFVYLLYSPKTGLRDIHTGLSHIWGMFIFVLLASHRSELHVSNIYIFLFT